MNLIWPYVKIIDLVDAYGMIAIYEPHPFNTYEWRWIYYDWCGNPVGESYDAPEGRLIYKVKPSDIESRYSNKSDAIRMCEYFNLENDKAKNEWEKRQGFGEI